VSRQHYSHVASSRALVAAAGRNATSAYSLEFQRDTLPVSDELRRHAFPFVAALRERRDAFKREGWPSKLADGKIDGFIDVLEYASVVVWQDWVVTRALEEIDDERRRPVEERNASEGDGWNFWEQDFFADAGEDWRALCDEARKRASHPKIPWHVQGTRAVQALAVAKQTLDVQNACSADARRVDDDVKELRELVDAKFAALMSMLRENLSAVASRAQLASGGETAPRGDARRKEMFNKSDVVAALQSREDLKATFTLPTFDSDSRKYLQG